jgi:integrase/recombinase XerD
MLEMLWGSEGKRKIRLHRKTNTELFQLYEAQLILRHRSQEALEEAKRVLSHFREYLGEFPPSPEIAAAFLAQFADRKTTTLYRYHSIIKTFMEWYGEPLDSKIRMPQTLPDYVKSDDIEKLKEAMKSKKTHKKVIDRNLLIIELAIKTGLRRNEIHHLSVKDINLERGYIEVREGKGQKDRIVDLTASLQQSLTIFIKGKQSEESVFGLTSSTISGIIHWAAQKAGVDIHTHSLRHHFGQSLVDNGTDLETVRRLMGHSSLKTTQVYIGRTDKQRRDAINSLENTPVNQTDDTKIHEVTDESLPLHGGRVSTPAELKPLSQTKHPSEAAVYKDQAPRTTSTDGILIHSEMSGTNITSAIGLRSVLNQQLYVEHSQKLTALVWSLVEDIKNANVEKEITNKAKTTSMFSSLGAIYRSQKLQLWPFLRRHLDNEFNNPRLSGEICTIAITAYWEQVMKKESDERGLVDKILEKLVILGERGYFVGTCDVCEGYFFQNKFER